MELTYTQIKELCKRSGFKPTELDFEDWLIVDNQTADEMCREYIEDSVWAFSSWFLASETGFDEDIFKAIQSNDKCEDNNEAILALIRATCGIESFVESAISCDGRGHFLSSYDGKEIKLPGDCVAYRTN